MIGQDGGGIWVIIWPGKVVMTKQKPSNATRKTEILQYHALADLIVPSFGPTLKWRNASQALQLHKDPEETSINLPHYRRRACGLRRSVIGSPIQRNDIKSGKRAGRRNSISLQRISKLTTSDKTYSRAWVILKGAWGHRNNSGVLE